MANVIFVEDDPEVTAWLDALIALSRDERKATLKEFCIQCGVTYRFLYAVRDGRSAISQPVLASLRQYAGHLGIDGIIQTKILQKKLGMGG